MLKIKDKIKTWLKLLATVVSGLVLLLVNCAVYLSSLLAKVASYLASPLGHLKTRQHMRHSPRLWRRRRVGATILLITLMVAMCFLWYYLADERIRSHAEEALERLTGGDADIDYASLSVLRNITIEGLHIYLPGRPHEPENLIFSAREVILHHEPKSLLQKQLRVKKIVADKAELNIWYDRNRKLTNLHLLNLKAPSESSPKRPVFILRNGTINYSEISQGIRSKPVTQKVSGRITPDAYSLQIYDFEFSSNKQGLFKNYSVKGSYNLQNQQFTTTSQIMLEEIDPNSIPASLANWRRLYEAVKPVGQVQTVSTYNPVTGHAFRISLIDASLYLPWLNDEYSLPLHNVNGQILCSNENITFKDLTSTFGSKGSLLLSGDINGYDKAAPFSLDLELQNLDIPANQWSGQGLDVTKAQQVDPPDENTIRLQTTLNALLKVLPNTAKKFIETIKPTGRMGLRLHLERQQDGGVANTSDIKSSELHTTCKGKLLFHDISISYKKFPYPVSGLEGPIDFNDGYISIGPLHSREGNQEVNIEGRYYHDEQKKGFDGNIEIKNLQLNEQVYGALKPGHQKIWDRLKPSGVVSVLWSKSFGESEKAVAAMDIELAAVNIKPDKFKLPLNNIAGKAHWQRGTIDLDISHTDFASGTMSFSGKLLHINEPEPTLDCKFEFNDLLLDDKLIDCLPGKIHEFLKEANAGGLVSGNGYVQGVLADVDLKNSSINTPIVPKNYELTVSLRDGSFNHVDLPYPMERVEARCELTEKGIKIDNLQGSQGVSSVSLHGRIAGENDYNLYLHCNPLELDERLHQLFVKRNWSIWEKINPSGKVKLSLLVNHVPAASKPSYQLSIEPLSAELRPSFFDYPLTNITGRINAKPGIITIENTVTQPGGGQIILKGEFAHNPERRDCKLNIKAIDLDIDDKLYEALCKKIFRNSSSPLLRQLNLSGKLNTNIDLTGRQEGQSINSWDFEGDAALSQGHVEAPVYTEGIVAKITGSGSYDHITGASGFKGKLLGVKMLAKGRELSELTSTVNYSSEVRELAFPDIVGDFCGGRLAGDCRLTLGENNTGYKIDLQFLEADIVKVIKVGSKNTQRYPKLRGKLDGRLSLLQPCGSEQRRGQFSFHIQEAILGELPVAAQLLHVLNLSLPKEGAFNEAEISGNIIGKKTRFEEIALRGSAIALSGAGVMTGTFLDLTREYNPEEISEKVSGDSDEKLPGYLELVFAVGAPRYLDGIPGLSSLYKAVQPELMRLQVSGVLDNLEVNTTALPSLSKALGQGEKPSKKNSSSSKPMPIPQTH